MLCWCTMPLICRFIFATLSCIYFIFKYSSNFNVLWTDGRLSESPYYNEDVSTKDSVDARGSPPTHNPSHGGLVSPPKVNIPEEYEMDCIDDTDNIYGNLERPAAIRVADFPEYVATKTKSKTDSLIHEFLVRWWIESKSQRTGHSVIPSSSLMHDGIAISSFLQTIPYPYHIPYHIPYHTSPKHTIPNHAIVYK